ncbi:MAG: type II and III secretion system protein, partial [Desulfatiglandales bacterium]
SLQSIVRAIELQGEVRTLSSPRINIMNGQTALLSVGTNQTYLSKVETTTTAGTAGTSTTTFTVETSSILSGILLGMVPFVSDMGEISLTITPIISDLKSLNPKNIGSQIELSLPTVELRELSTSVKARDGETIILGGLISQKETMEDNQVPLLGKVPLLGLLFKSREKASRKTEMVILLKPSILPK